jgi:hypothetical protein
MTMAEDTPKSSTRVARNVYRYKDADAVGLPSLPLSAPPASGGEEDVGSAAPLNVGEYMREVLEPLVVDDDGLLAEPVVVIDPDEVLVELLPSDIVYYCASMQENPPAILVPLKRGVKR